MTGEPIETPWPVGFVPIQMGLESDARRYVMGECAIILGTMPNGRKHLSISHADRNPTWDEIHDARYKLLPKDKTYVLYLPPKKEYVNVHQHTFHLHECLCWPEEER